jgi:succinyl-CoA synthetase beta subunit
MKIHEYQAKELFREYGIPVTEEATADTAEEARQTARKIGLPVVIKAQVLVGGRGKAGGVKIAKTLDEAETAAREILSLTVQSLPVSKVLVAKAEQIERETYVGLTVDRAKKKITLMISAEGGVDIEELAVHSPEKILRAWADPFDGFDKTELDTVLEKVFDRDLVSQARNTIMKLYKLFLDKGCSLVEINPFAHIQGDGLSALDAKINFDDNAVPFHPELNMYRNIEEVSEDELNAQKAGLHFIGMDGDIGCVVNGAGLAMATMDIIKLYGAMPANFLDVGGSSSPEKVLTALRVILGIPKVKGVLFNIFGGITRCDDIARGILMAKEQIDIDVPIVIRLIGTNDAEGRELLSEAGIPALKNLDEAVQEVIAQTRGK